MVDPLIVYGTAWKKERTTELTLQALRFGFRGIDTANQPKHYQEEGVGEALVQARSHGISREELFLQTKFTPLDGQDHRVPYDPNAPVTAQVEASFQTSLEHLRTDYLDAYLLHGPYTGYGLTDDDWEAWGAMEKIHETQKAKAIGVSNVNLDQLEFFCQSARTKPMIVQNRCYASRGWDEDVRTYCAEHGIVYQGFSLLTANLREITQPALRGLCEKYGKSIPQLVFCFSRQIGILPLTGTTDLGHMQEDLTSFDIQIEEEDLSIFFP